MIPVIVAFLFFTFAEQPEYCQMRTLFVKDIGFYAGWDDGKLSGEPDPAIVMDICHFDNLSDDPRKRCPWNYTLFNKQLNEQREFSSKGPYIIHDFNFSDFEIRVGIYEDDVAPFQISDKLYPLRTSDLIRKTEDYTYKLITGVEYDWWFEYNILVLCSSLVPCSSRLPLPSSGCRSSFDTTNCYEQIQVLDTGRFAPMNACGESCIFPNLTSGVNGKCVLLPCNQRRVQTESTFILPCGDRKSGYPYNEDACYVQIDNVTCDDECGQNRSPIYLTNDTSVWGYCNQSLCSDRVPDQSLRYPCITRDCYEQVEEIQQSIFQTPCAFPCDYPTNYIPVNGKCVLKNCASRVYNSTKSINGKNPYPCGDPTCYLHWNNKCMPLCVPPEHSIGNNTSGRCVLKDCDARTIIDNPYYPCGDTRTCLQQIEDGVASTTCGPTCPSTDHTTEHMIFAQCVLKPCELRVYNASASYPCGEATCYQQMENGTSTNACGLDCPSDYTVEDNTTGRCVIQDCDQRVFNSSAEFPCGDANCYQQIENGTTTIACGSDCPSAHTIADNSTGRCVLKECNQRMYNASTFYPCGEAGCYQQIENGNFGNSCGIDCVSSDLDKTTGRCILKDSKNAKGFNTVVVVSTVVPVIVLVVIVLIIAGYWYSKKKSRAEKSVDRMLEDRNSMESKSGKRGTVKMELPAGCEFDNDYPRLPEHQLEPACSSLSKYPEESAEIRFHENPSNSE